MSKRISQLAAASTPLNTAMVFPVWDPAVAAPNGNYSVRFHQLVDFVSPVHYGAVAGTGVSSAVRIANVVAFDQAMAAAASTALPMFIPGNTFEIEGTLDATPYDGIKIVGCGPNSSVIIQYTDNIPILKVGEPTGLAATFRGVVCHGFALQYANFQTGNTSATALWLGHLFQSVFSHLRLDNGYNLISNAAADLSVFNTSFLDIDMFNWVEYALHIKRTPGVSGNYYRNLYFATSTSGLSSHANARDVTGVMRLTNAGQGVLDQINPEWCRPSEAAINLTLSEDMIINAVNFEGITPRGGKGLVYVEDSNVVMGGVTVNNCRFMDTEGCTKAAIAVMGDRGAIEIENLRVLTVTVTGLTEYIFQSDDLGTGNIDATCRLGLFKPKSGHSLSGIANTVVAASSQFKRHPLVGVGATGLEGNIHLVGNGDVTVKAELHPIYIMVNAAITGARTLTLSQYMNAGDSILVPNGAKKIIWRNSSATGAFNYNINNWDGTLIQALAAALNWAEVAFDGTNWVLVRTG